MLPRALNARLFAGHASNYCESWLLTPQPHDMRRFHIQHKPLRVDKIADTTRDHKDITEPTRLHIEDTASKGA